MNPLIHAELSWLIAQKLENRRDRILVMVAGIAPDLDGLTLLAGRDAYEDWHHLLTHGFIAAVAVTALCTAFSKQRLLTGALSLAAFHLHLICDLAGSGREWPIFYLYPLSRHATSWAYVWELASWQNSVIGFLVTIGCLACALKFGRTFVEVFSPKADAQVVATLRKRFL